MCKFNFRLVVALLTFGIGILGVSIWIIKNTPHTTTIEAPNISAPEITIIAPAISHQAAVSPIRLIDFQNFTYSLPKDLTDSTNPKRAFTLKDGEHPETEEEMGIYLGRVEYGDVTNDNQEDAIVTMSIQTGGSATPHIVYVYSLENDGPKLLWNFSTGDRADDGLKDVYAENGRLVVELYSPVEAQGACCPKFFNRSKYKWSGKKFQKVETQKLLPVS